MSSNMPARTWACKHPFLFSLWTNHLQKNGPTLHWKCGPIPGFRGNLLIGFPLLQNPSIQFQKVGDELIDIPFPFWDVRNG